ncbi:ribonuclease E/G, partial [bacterium]|nr:ribonuclease E/G [bacterium]
MTKEIRINTSSEETRIAILEEGNLVELYTERPENERMVGDIYKGRVENVVSAVQAAFVNIGLSLNGFLPFSEIGTQSAEFIAFSEKVSEEDEGQHRRPRRHQRPHRSQHVRTGQELLVQVTKEPIGSKGARLTTAISLPGRFLVLVPGDQSIGVSRKISDVRERRRLRMLAKSIQPEGCGLIMRTVAVGKDAQALQADLESLLKTWRRIEEKA